MVRLRLFLVPLALAGMLAITGLVIARIYAGDLTGRLLAGAAVGAVLVSVLLRRLPAWTVAPMSVLALAGYTAWTVRLAAASGGIPGAVPDLARDALGNGIPRLLTAMLPIEPQPDTVVVPVVATWLAGLAAAELGVRGGRVLLSYLPPTVLLGGGLYLVGPNLSASFWLPLGFAGCAAVGLAASTGAGSREQVEPVLSRGQRSTLRVRVAAAAVAGLSVIGVLATLLGPSVAGRVDATPSDPRRYVTPPRLDSLDESPLVRLSGWALNPDQHLFDVAVNRSDEAKATRVRLAVLSDYDGVTWRVGATYRSAGRVLSGPSVASPGTTAAGTEIEQRITIGELDGRLLPAAPLPRRVDGVRVAYDEVTGTLALPDGLRPGLAYTVVSRQEPIEVNLLPAAEVASGEEVVRYLSLPGTVPVDIQRLATQLSEGVAAPYQRAQAIEQFLAEHYQLVTDAASGHAYPNLSFFLFGPRNGGGQRGTAEQFAAAFAVLARALALPTRVAVGFNTEPGRPAVRAADASAWPEVLFEGVGWVPFNPLPQPNTSPRPIEDDFRPRPPPSAPPPAVVATPSASAAPSAPPAGVAAGQPPAAGSRAGVLVAGVSGFGIAVLGLAVAVPLLRRALRRRRLLRGEPADRVAGAWLEVLDGLRLAGRPAAAHLAASEVACYAERATQGPTHTDDRAGGRLPAPTVKELAALVNAVAFGLGPVPDSAAQRAAAQATAYVDDLRGRRPWWRRALWTFDPRPLLWARRRRRQARQRNRAL